MNPVLLIRLSSRPRAQAQDLGHRQKGCPSHVLHSHNLKSRTYPTGDSTTGSADSSRTRKAFNVAAEGRVAKAGSNPLTQDLMRGLNSVGLCLLHETAVTKAKALSIFVSPYSLGAALITMLGPLLSDAAANEIVCTFGMPAPASMASAVQAFRTLTEPFSARDHEGILGHLSPLDTSSPQVVTANSAWLRDDFRATSACQAILADSNAKLGSFSARTRAGDNINSWVKQHTQGMIPSVVNSSLPPDLVLALVNALYFKAKWMYPFDHSNTKSAAFYESNGTSKVAYVTMMNMLQDGIEFARVEGIGQAVRLRCKQDEAPANRKSAFAATFVLPHPGSSPEAALAMVEALGGFKAAVSDHLSFGTVDLSLPRFRAACTRSWDAELQDLGIKKAFSASDSGLSRSVLGQAAPTLAVSQVVQSVTICVDEEGAEAAAVTVVEMTYGSRWSPPYDFMMEVNRPFIMVLEELTSNVIAFAGIVRQCRST
jgi:serine protease inhibitor